MKGCIHSVQSFGAADGPGLRYMVFTQGCPLRCGCCHNPDTWDTDGGYEAEPASLLAEIKKYRPYFGETGGVTVSGGEPLLQPDFCRELFALCKEAGIHTCLDTSGCLLNEKVQALLPLCDLVLLDVKYMSEEKYKAYTGGSFLQAIRFLAALKKQNIPVWLRQVLIPGLNDSTEELLALGRLKRRYPNVERIELLPFKKLCTVKYDAMGLAFPFAHIPAPTQAQLEAARNFL